MNEQNNSGQNNNNQPGNNNRNPYGGNNPFGPNRPNDPNNNPNRNNNNPFGPGGGRNRQPMYMFVLFCVIALLVTRYVFRSGDSSDPDEISYSQFMDCVENDGVESVEIEEKKINIVLKEGVEVPEETSDEEDNVGKDDAGKDDPADGSGSSGENGSSEENGSTEPGSTEKPAEPNDALSGDQSQVINPFAIAEEATKDNRKYYTNYISDEALLRKLQMHDVEIHVAKEDNTGAIIYNILSFILPVALLIGFYAYLMKRGGGGPLGMGRSAAKVYVEKSTGVTFADVAGQEEAKESLVEVVDFLHNPKKYTQIGAKLPRGALLVGPPGTGKTLLAKAVAGEAGVPFFSLAGSDFVEMFVGVGASRVRDLFKEAQKTAPCIIFIDEIDAIGKSRDSRYGGGNDEREQTLNQLLAEMDGFDTSKGLLILAATNRPEVLDKALLRPGRFDRRIIVDRPDRKGRLETLKVHSKDVAMDESVDLDAMALASAGLVGSDLANIINEAAILAVKADRQYVNQEDLFEAFELVAVGGKEKKDRVMSESERHTVACHEVGHALVTAFLKNTEPVQKITIVPRTMGALGYTLQTPEEEKFLETKDELLSKITTYMAGRAAEDLVFGSSTSGAADDIEKATSIARNMVTRFGMSERFGMMGLATVESQYLEGHASLTCGEATAAQIDEEVHAIITGCYDKAYGILEKNRNALDKIADYLFDRETITGKEFMDMFRELTGIEESEEEKQKRLEEEAEKEANKQESRLDTLLREQEALWK